MALIRSANVGNTDRILRVVAGIVVAVLAYMSLSAPWSIVAFVVAAVLIVTALVRFCPAYRLIGANTCRTSRG